MDFPNCSKISPLFGLIQELKMGMQVNITNLNLRDNGRLKMINQLMVILPHTGMEF